MKTIKDYRLQLGMSQSQLARKLKVSIDSIKSWENDRRLPPKYLPDYLEHLVKNSIEKEEN